MFDLIITVVVSLVMYVFLNSIKLNPKEKILDDVELKYFCPICGSQCSYWNYTTGNVDGNIIFEIRCNKYCSNCGTRLNYKKINDKKQIIYRVDNENHIF